MWPATKLSFLLLGVTILVGAPPARGVQNDSALKESMSSFARLVNQSVQILRLRDGKVLFDLNSNSKLIPASVTKVVTSAAILSRFDPPHTFSTGFYYSGTRKHDVVSGDLIIKGDGDPFIVSEHLWQVAADIKHLGIKEFKGRIVIDNSLFDAVGRDASRKFGRSSSRNAYDAPVSAFGVNFNTYGIAVSPHPTPGKQALVEIDPYPLNDIQIDNKIKTVSSGKKNGFSISRIASKKLDKLVASGVVRVDSKMTKKYRSVSDHVLSSGEYVRSFLKAQGIRVHGAVVSGRIPRGAQKILDLNGYQVRKIVQGLNTYSNNYIADVIVKRLGAAFPTSGKADARGQGSFANGITVLKNFLQKDVGIKDKFVLQNGSGLSPENRLSAEQIVKVLAHMENSFKVFPEFLASLPASGWDGTMKKRMRSHKGNYGLVRAKTGTLTAPVTAAGLAGYMRHSRHGLVAFCILENGKIGKKQPSVISVRDHQDEFLNKFLKD